jgi:hypothetical protein
MAHGQGHLIDQPRLQKLPNRCDLTAKTSVLATSGVSCTFERGVNSVDREDDRSSGYCWWTTSVLRDLITPSADAPDRAPGSSGMPVRSVVRWMLTTTPNRWNGPKRVGIVAKKLAVVVKKI